MLNQPAVFSHDGRFMASWCDENKLTLARAQATLSAELKSKLSPYCTHVKHHGGVKRSLRLLMRVLGILLRRPF